MRRATFVVRRALFAVSCAVAAITCALVLAACAAGARKASAPASAAPEAASGAPSPLGADPHAQIEELDAKITAARTELSLEEPAADSLPGTPLTPLGVQPYTQDPTCRPAQTETCKTSCTLSDSICGNADSICRIAVDLPADTWAQNKCAKANKTCEASRKKCCGCQ